MGNGKSFLFMADKKKIQGKAGNTMDSEHADHIFSFLIIFLSVWDQSACLVMQILAYLCFVYQLTVLRWVMLLSSSIGLSS